MKIKPIETTYKGHLFRSRLEARWAVFFDALGVEWQYEPQGYVITDPWGTESRPYLPDFYLPVLDVWAEVKGDPEGVDWTLWGVAVDAGSQSGLPDSRRAYSGFDRPGSALLILGAVPDPCPRAWMHPLLVNAKGVSVGQVAFGPRPHDFAVDVSDIGCFESSWCGFDGDFQWSWGQLDHDGEPSGGAWKEPMHAEVALAYDRARKARFEHGAMG